MEKVVYVIWADEVGHLADDLRGDVADRLTDCGASHVQVNVADEAVCEAAPLRIDRSGPGPVAMVSLWLDSANDPLRAPVDAVISSAAQTTRAGSRAAGYLVTESVPLANTVHPPQPGERTHGFAQIACLTRPTRLEHHEWRSIWQNDHTQLAIDTQSTFGYVQNLVVRSLTPGAPPYAAIVEELFPAEAMNSTHAFFDAVGDDDRLRHNIDAMVASTSRFLDVDQLDVFPTSQYAID